MLLHQLERQLHIALSCRQEAGDAHIEVLPGVSDNPAQNMLCYEVAPTRERLAS